MADHHVGTLFIELDLDDSKFTKRQKSLLADATRTTLNLESNYKKLGIKTSNELNMMANKVVNAYTRIANSSKSSAQDIARAHRAMSDQISKIDTQRNSAINSTWKTLGRESVAAINAQKSAARAAYQEIRNSSTSTYKDIAAARMALHTRLTALNRDMVGGHDASMAAMTRAVLRFYAAYYVASNAIRAMLTPLKAGVKVMDEFNTSVASMAAMVVTFAKRPAGMDLAGHFKEALKYSKELIPVLEDVAARTLMSGQETIALANAFARAGVFLNAANDAQMEGFARIANALPLMTRGQEIMKQINSEIRSVMMGTSPLNSMLLITLREIDTNLDSNIEKWRKTGTVIENVGRLLEGFGPATAILEMQWTAVKNAVDTTFNRILRKGMTEVYPEIIKQTKELNEWLKENGDTLSEIFSAAAEKAVAVANALGAIAKVMAETADRSGETFSQRGDRQFKETVDAWNNFVRGSKGIYGEFLRQKEVLADTNTMYAAHGKVLEMASAHQDKYKRLLIANTQAQEENTEEVGKIITKFEEKVFALKNDEKAQLANTLAVHKATDPHKEYVEQLSLEVYLLENAAKAKKAFEAQMAESSDAIAENIADGERMIQDRDRKAREDAKAEAERLQEKAEAQEKSIQDYIDGLKKEIEMIGMDEAAKERLTAAEQGLTGARLKAIEAMISYKHAQNALWARAREADEAIAGNIADGERMAQDADRDRAKQAKKDAESAAKEWEKASKESAKEWEHFLERVQDATADTLYDIFDGAIDGFDDLLDRMGDLLKRVLAEWAAQALLKPVIVPIVQSAAGLFGGVTGGTTASGTNGLTTQAGSLLWGNYGQGTGLGQYLAGAAQYDLLPSAATSYDALTGLPTSNIGGGSLGAGYTVGDALGYFGLGSLGYSTIGDWIGLPQSEYSGVAAGAGAALGGYGGAALGSSALLAGATYGSYLGPIGAVVGAVLGGLLGSVFGGQESKKYVDLTNMPNMDQSWGYGQTPGFASFDTDQWKSGINNVGYDNLNSYDKGLSDMMFATVMDGLAPMVQGVYDTVDDMLAGMPDALAADIKKDLDGMGAVFSMEEINKRIVRNRGDRAELDIERILTETGDMMLEKIIPVFEASVGEYLQGMMEDSSGILSKLDSRHVLSKFVGNSSIFNADFSKASGASFETYGQSAGEFIAAAGQLTAAWDAVTNGFSLMIDPMTSFESKLSDITNTVDGAVAVLEQLGFNEEALADARERGNAVIQDFLKDSIEDIMKGPRGDLQRMSMTDTQYSITKITEEYKELRKALYELYPRLDADGVQEWANALQELTIWRDKEVEAIEKTVSATRSLQDSVRELWDDDVRMRQISARYDNTPISTLRDRKETGQLIYDAATTPSVFEGLVQQMGGTEEAAEQLTSDMQYLAQMFLEFDAKAKDIAVTMQGLVKSFKFDAHVSSGGGRSDFYWQQIDEFMAKEEALTMEELLEVKDLSTSWYNAAMAERQEVESWKNMLKGAIETLLDSIESTVKSIKYSNLNVALPSQKYQDAQKDYNALFAKAVTGDQDAIQEYLAFAPEYLQSAQNKYKSSTPYQKIYDKTMADMEIVKKYVETPNFEASMLKIAQEQKAVDAAGYAKIEKGLEIVNTFLQEQLSLMDELDPEDEWGDIFEENLMDLRDTLNTSIKAMQDAVVLELAKTNPEIGALFTALQNAINMIPTDIDASEVAKVMDGVLDGFRQNIAPLLDKEYQNVFAPENVFNPQITVDQADLTGVESHMGQIATGIGSMADPLASMGRGLFDLASGTTTGMDAINGTLSGTGQAISGMAGSVDDLVNALTTFDWTPTITITHGGSTGTGSTLPPNTDSGWTPNPAEQASYGVYDRNTTLWAHDGTWANLYKTATKIMPDMSSWEQVYNRYWDAGDYAAKSAVADRYGYGSKLSDFESLLQATWYNWSGHLDRFGGEDPARRKTMYGFAEGGIVTGPESGYPVTLHGTEKVTPLRGGRDEELEELKKQNALLQQLVAEMRTNNTRPVVATVSRTEVAGVANDVMVTAHNRGRIRPGSLARGVM